MALLSNEAESLREVEKLPNKVAADVKAEALAREALSVVQVKVKDTRKATVAKKLLDTTVSFAGIDRRCQQWTVAPSARQCSTCHKWGHSAYVCRSRTPQCGSCAGNHLTALHGQHIAQCKTPNCTHYQIRCVNCNAQHEASSVSCPFFKA